MSDLTKAEFKALANTYSTPDLRSKIRDANKRIRVKISEEIKADRRVFSEKMKQERKDKNQQRLIKTKGLNREDIIEEMAFHRKKHFKDLKTKGTYNPADKKKKPKKPEPKPPAPKPKPPAPKPKPPAPKPDKKPDKKISYEEFKKMSIEEAGKIDSSIKMVFYFRYEKEIIKEIKNLKPSTLEEYNNAKSKYTGKDAPIYKGVFSKMPSVIVRNIETIFFDNVPKNIKKPEPNPDKGKGKGKAKPKFKVKPNKPDSAPEGGGGGGSAEGSGKIQPDLIESMLNFKRSIPVSFSCWGGMSFYLFLEIMIRNKNDCLLEWKKITQLKNGLGGGNVESFMFFGEEYALSLKDIRNVKSKEVLLKKYQECKKNNKIFCMPIFKSGHANMMVFNTIREEVEYYEPHGTGTKPYEDAVKGIVKYFNANGEPNVKYSASEDSCPKIDKSTAEEWEKMNVRLREKWLNYANKKVKPKGGLQTLDGTDEQRKEKQKVKGRMISDTGGFCCMWSFLQMDFRLKNPKAPTDELANRLVKKIKGNPKQFFREYIRGYTYDIMERLVNALGEEDYEKMTNINRNKGDRTRLNFKIAQIITKMYKEAGGK